MTRGSKGRRFQAEETVLQTNGGMREQGVLKEMKDEVFMGKYLEVSRQVAGFAL